MKTFYSFPLLLSLPVGSMARVNENALTRQNGNAAQVNEFIISEAAYDATEIPLTDWRNIEGNDRPDGKGAAHTPLPRLVPPVSSYNNGSNMLRGPNPRDVSNAVSFQGTAHIANDRRLSDMIWAWGQFLDHDVVETPNGGAQVDIEIQETDSEFQDPLVESSCRVMPFRRSIMFEDTNTQRNAITSFVDGSNVYGSDELRAYALRTHANGLLRTSADGLLMPDSDGTFENAGEHDVNPNSVKFFFAGDVRANEQAGLAAMHTLFVREHNRLARALTRRFIRDEETMSEEEYDELIYQMARKLVGAEMQIITYNEFLPALLGQYAPVPDEYDENFDPSITNEFATVAFRVGHTMLSSFLMLGDKQGAFDSVPLRDIFFNPDYLRNNPENVDYLLCGFLHQTAQEIDTFVTEDVRSFLFNIEGHDNMCLDLVSLNIHRGRDHGMPTYNTLREVVRLPAVSNFEDITSNADVVSKLKSVYKTVDEVDAFIGALAEDHVEGASVGELLKEILVQQFTAVAKGDPFFYKWDPDLTHDKLNGIWNQEEISLEFVIKENTQLKNLGGKRLEAFFVLP